jgi:GDPmannose 4,6-dehydratase
MKRALICGISGQDGAYLARFLIGKGYQVFGTSRDAQISRFENLSRLGIRDSVTCLTMAMTDFRSVLQVLTETSPDELYDLSGQSSVALSFMLPVETLESIIIGTLNLLEAARFAKKATRIFNAATSECFGNTSRLNASTEMSPFRPRSPYGVAKAASFWEVANYREAYDLFACSGILFNHESSLRPARYVSRKVVQTATAIANGSVQRLKLGELNTIRDWGWTAEYVEAMWMMLQKNNPDDYIIATGQSHSLEEFVSTCFAELGLDWRKYVDIDPELFRKTDIKASYANPEKAANELGWKAQTQFPDLVQILLREEKSGLISQAGGAH